MTLCDSTKKLSAAVLLPTTSSAEKGTGASAQVVLTESFGTDVRWSEVNRTWAAVQVCGQLCREI